MSKTKIAILIAIISLFLALVCYGVGRFFQNRENQARIDNNRYQNEEQYTDNENKTDNTIIIDKVTTDNI